MREGWVGYHLEEYEGPLPYIVERKPVNLLHTCKASTYTGNKFAIKISPILNKLQDVKTGKVAQVKIFIFLENHLNIYL